MKLNSPIGQLIGVLEQVKESASRNASKLNNNEANTRAVLIDPVVRALGWDTTNPDMVEFEKYFRNTKLDYALNDCQGAVRVIIEAKALGTNLSDDRIFTTILTYGITYRIPNVFLTDGMIWKHYKLAEFSQMDPKIFDLRNTSLANIALYLIANLDVANYWSESQPAAVREEIKIVEPVQISTPVRIVKPAVNVTDSPSQGGFIPLASLDKNLTGVKPPSSLRLPDGSIKSIKTWRDLLFESVLFVLANTPDLLLPLKDKAGKKCLLIDYQKMNQKGVIVKGKYLEKEVFIFLNYDSNNTVKNALYILDFLPRSVSKYPAAVAY